MISEVSPKITASTNTVSKARAALGWSLSECWHDVGGHSIGRAPTVSSSAYARVRPACTGYAFISARF